MSDEYSREVKDGVRLLKVGIIYGANASGKSNILNAIEFFRMLVLRMPKDRNEKTRVVPFYVGWHVKKWNDKDVDEFLYQPVEVHPQFWIDAKYIYSETLIVYDSIRPTKLYSRSYDAETDSHDHWLWGQSETDEEKPRCTSGNTINNCSVSGCIW